MSDIESDSRSIGSLDDLERKEETVLDEHVTDENNSIEGNEDSKSANIEIEKDGEEDNASTKFVVEDSDADDEEEEESSASVSLKEKIEDADPDTSVTEEKVDSVEDTETGVDVEGSGTVEDFAETSEVLEDGEEANEKVSENSLNTEEVEVNEEHELETQLSEAKLTEEPQVENGLVSETPNANDTTTAVSHPEDAMTIQPYEIPEEEEEEKEEEEEVEAPATNFARESVSEIPQLPAYHYTRSKMKSEEIKSLTRDFLFGLAVVDFDHIKGPELTHWLDEEVINARDEEVGNRLIFEKVEHYSKVWPYLAFQALPDGVHMYGETFTQFTLCYDELKKMSVELPFEQFDVVSESEGEGEGEDEKDVDVDVGKREVISMEDPNQGVVTLFGCACIRQVETSLLMNMRADVKRSVVQKSVILITRCPLPIQVKEQLSIVTKSWFEQYDFTDMEILKMLYRNVSTTYNVNGYIMKNDELYDEGRSANEEGSSKIIKESDFYMGMNFQETVHKMRRNLLMIFKCLIVGEGRILIFSKDLNALSNVQYCLIGLISNLILELGDCGYPLSDSFLESDRRKVDSLKSSDRCSVLKFMGLPLRVFGYGGFFQPYLTLQQLSYITNANTKSFLVGSSNDIILEHKREWFDMVVYLDEKDSSILSSIGYGKTGCKVEIIDKTLKEKLNLSWADKKFIDRVVECVDAHYQVSEDTTGEAEAEAEAKAEAEAETKTSAEAESEPETASAGKNSAGSSRGMTLHGRTINCNASMDNESYEGSDDFIRSAFEDYLIGFLSSVKYDNFLQREKRIGGEQLKSPMRLDVFENEIGKFGAKYSEWFRESSVYRHWDAVTEDELFNFFEPKHVGASGDGQLGEERRGKPAAALKQWLGQWRDKPVAGSGGAGPVETLRGLFAWGR